MKVLLILVAILFLIGQTGVKASVRPEWMPIEDVRVGKTTLSKVLERKDLGTDEVYCASSRIVWDNSSTGIKYLNRVLYPAITNSKAMVSPDTVCSFDVRSLRATYVNRQDRLYREIATGIPEFPDLIPAAQKKGFLPLTAQKWCRAESVGVYGSNYVELRYSRAFFRPLGVYAIYVSRDMECTTNPKVVSNWEKSGWVKLTLITNPWE